MTDLSLTSLLALELRRIVVAAQAGLDDPHRYADAVQAYERLRAALSKEMISELWAKARAARKSQSTGDALYWLAAFGAERDRRYQADYRKRPKAKKKRAAYMREYQGRPAVKKGRAAYMREYRALKKKELQGDHTKE